MRKDSATPATTAAQQKPHAHVVRCVEHDSLSHAKIQIEHEVSTNFFV